MGDSHDKEINSKIDIILQRTLDLDKIDKKIDHILVNIDTITTRLDNTERKYEDISEKVNQLSIKRTEDYNRTVATEESILSHKIKLGEIEKSCQYMSDKHDELIVKLNTQEVKILAQEKENTQLKRTLDNLNEKSRTTIYQNQYKFETVWCSHSRG